MSFSLSELKPHFLSPTLEDRKMAALLERIKVMYTIDRKGLEKKVWTRDEVSSYAAYYLPTNFEKFSFVMEQLPPEIRTQLASCEVVDFGTGPGTYLLAYARFFGLHECKGLIGIDKEELMLEQAESLLTGLFTEAKELLSMRSDTSLLKTSHKRLLIFGNSCNEMTVSQIEKVIDDVEAQFVLFIEPGTPVVFDQIIKLRSKFKEKNFECFYPCPSLELDCPIVKRVEQGQDDWCHQVWRGTHDASIERLGQLAKIDRKVMPFIAHFYGNTIVHAHRSEARFVRFLSENKHSFQWEVCFRKSEGLTLCKFEIPKKTLMKKQVKEMKKMSVGENFEFEIINKLGEDHFRVKVSF